MNVLARIWISFCGGVFATIACYVLRKSAERFWLPGTYGESFFAPRSGGANQASASMRSWKS